MQHTDKLPDQSVIPAGLSDIFGKTNISAQPGKFKIYTMRGSFGRLKNLISGIVFYLRTDTAFNIFACIVFN